MRSSGLLLAVLGLGCALAGCAGFNTRPYRPGHAGACSAAPGADGAPAGLPRDEDCLRNGISYFELMPAVITYVLTTASGADGAQVPCVPQCIQEYKLLPDPERRMVLEHHPGLFGSSLNVSFRENGTLASIGVESKGIPADVAVAALKAALPAPEGKASKTTPDVKCSATPSLLHVARVTSLAALQGLDPGGKGPAACCVPAHPCP